MIFTYLDRLRHFAFTGFAVWTDLIYALLSLAGSVLINPRNTPVASITSHDIGMYALAFAGFFLGIRVLLVAPYFVWKEAYAEKRNLREQLDSPAHIERQELARLRAAKKIELITRIRSAQFAAASHDAAGYDNHITEAANLHHQAIPDTSLHDAMRVFMTTCRTFIENQDTEYSKLVAVTERVIYTVHGSDP